MSGEKRGLSAGHESRAAGRTEVVGIVCVVVLALGLLLYVAWGETLRTHTRFLTERLQSQMRPLQTSVESHLQSGLPIRQFPGFTSLATELINSDDVLRTLSMRGADGQWLFDSQPPEQSAFSLEIPLRSRYETAGYLVLSLDDDAITAALRRQLLPVLVSAVLLGIACVAGLLRAAGRENPERAQARILISTLVVQMLIIAGVMWSVYSQGAQGAARAQADSLLTRFAAALDYGLSFDDFSDVPDVLAQARLGSRNLQSLTVRLNGEALYASRSSDSVLQTAGTMQLGSQRPLQTDPPAILGVDVEVPSSAVTMAIARNLKNFAFLGLASVFVALLLLRLLHSFASAHDDRNDTQRAELESRKASALLFLAVFCDQVSAAFLPSWVAQLATAQGYSSSAAAWPFTAYFVGFATVLAPAQMLASRGRYRGVLVGGSLLVCVASLLLALVPNFIATLAARGLAGIGQGMVFVGVQAVLLAWSSTTRSLGANTSIVFQFNAAMICGLALGSLLVVYVQPVGIFTGVALLALMLAWLAGGVDVPSRLRSPVASPSAQAAILNRKNTGDAFVSKHSPRHAAWGLAFWRDPGFAIPALCVGIPSKAVMTGIVVYALPLMLSTAQLEHEEIGQFLLFYAVGVLACNAWLQNRRPALTALASLTGLAMFASALAITGLAWVMSDANIRLSGWTGVGILLLCVALLGIAHGAINAPVVTLVGSSASAKLTAQGSAATYYRLVERAGHVAGPLLVAQSLMWFHDWSQALAWLAGGVGILGIVAVAGSYRLRRQYVLAGLTGLLALGLTTGLNHAPSAAQINALSQPVMSDPAQKPAQADARGGSGAVASWLTLHDASLKNWSVQGDVAAQSGDADELSLTPLFQGQQSEGDVLLILFKASPAYDIAVSRMLDVWAQRGVAPRVQIVNAAGNEARAHAAVQSALSRGVALIIGVGSDTTAFLHDKYRQGKVPLLSVCAKDPVLMKQVDVLDRGSGTSMAYTSLNAPVDVQFSHLLQARPGLRHLAIIVDRRNSSAMQTQALPLQAHAEAAGVRVHRVVVDSSSDVVPQLQDTLQQARLAMQRDDALGAESLFWITGSSALFKQMAVINRVAAGVPVFSAVPDLVVQGPDSADVSIGVSFEENAYLAALYAQRILSGRDRPGDLPVGVVSPPEIGINFMKARQSGLRLPFALFEKAGTVYNSRGELVRWQGSTVGKTDSGSKQP